MKLIYLTRPGTLTIQCRFIHHDGLEHYFWSAVNDLTGDRLSGWDNNPPSVGDTEKWAKSVIRDIKRKAVIIELIEKKTA